MNTQLLIIDPQNDFIDQPRAALPVAGAAQDMQRLAGFVTKHNDALTGVTVTLDTHAAYDIAHPTWWRDADGAHPAPMSPITLQDVQSGRWTPVDPSRRQHALDYLAQCGLWIWPEHCLKDTWGGAVYPALAEALTAVATKTIWLRKGENPDTEHFSAFEADVPLASDPEYTAFNPRNVAQLIDADRILVAGEALSHCVASSVRSLVRHLGPEFAQRLVLLTDCMSPVPGFEAQGEAFIAEMAALGVGLATTQTALVAAG